MQLIWMSGPTDRVVTVAITRRRVVGAVLLAASLLVMLGAAFHFVGLRIAVEHSPSLARQIGGVTSLGEMHRIDEAWRQETERIEARHRERLSELAARLAAAQRSLADLESTKDAFVRSLGLNASRVSARPALAAAGQGGPWRRPFADPLQAAAPGSEPDSVSQVLERIEERLASNRSRWREEFALIGLLPLSLPLAGEFSVSSGFGVRVDPFTGALSAHEGLDLIAARGTPVLATAPGVVTLSEWGGPFGQVVEVRHAHGYLTRYAHLSRRSVSAGDRVERGDQLGALGSTGRSTGPHLHYEIEHAGRPIDPMRALGSVLRRD
jgi:murein DD-endopeptidase MepM/ murein hydrolase activator NlpD